MSFWSDKHLLEAGGNAEEVLVKIARITTWSRECRFVWRGHPCEDWTLHSGLYERVQKKLGTPPDEARLRVFEKDLLDQAGRRDLGGGRDVPELQRLAVLQHHGTATRLLDVTTDPIIALWFACEAAQYSKHKGVLFAIEVSAATHLDWSERRPIVDVLEGLADNQLATYLPEPLDARIQVQRGAFVFGRVPDDSATRAAASVPINVPVWTVTNRKEVFGTRGPGRPKVPSILALRIPQNAKRRLLAILESSYGYTSESIFPDIDGFSRARGRHSPLP